jgi:hypothetical protein
MRRILTYLVVIGISGCQSIPDLPPLPEIPNTSKLEPANLSPLPIPDKPKAKITTVDNEKVAVFNSQGIEQLNIIYDRSKINEKLVTRLDRANNHLVDSYNAMLELRALEQHKTKIVERELAKSERQREIDQFQHRMWQLVDKILLACLIFITI